MADQDLAVTGKDVSVELLVAGVPAGFTDKVVRFTENAEYQENVVRHLGSTGKDIDLIPDGWSGDLEVSRKSGGLDDIIDAINLARRNNVPTLLLITRTIRFRDGTSRTHVYPDCKLKFSTESSRGQSVTTRVSWMCGTDRVAV